MIDWMKKVGAGGPVLEGVSRPHLRGDLESESRPHLRGDLESVSRPHLVPLWKA